MGTKRVVGFSGGADSQECANWVLDRYPADDVILLNTEAGRNEHPLTVMHRNWFSAHVHPVIEVVPLVRDLGTRGTEPGAIGDRRREFSDDDELTFDRLAYIKGRFPSKKAQFCTEHLKLAPQKRWCDENLLDRGIDYERYIGVRRDESRDRKCASLEEFDDYFDVTIHRPLADWTKQEVFDSLKARGQEINPLYRMGFSRVGCAPCINSGKDDIRNWAARFPEMIDKVREWEKRVGRTFFPPMLPGCDSFESDDPRKINWVDQVVEWAKTARGGQQYALPFVELDAAAGACSSKYGLCE
jgi:3'-phosphoadenosine 5'-phosphosulfate sulfotransferase (PAPS reductase)/FAD synthetase